MWPRYYYFWLLKTSGRHINIGFNFGLLTLTSDIWCFRFDPAVLTLCFKLKVSNINHIVILIIINTSILSQVEQLTSVKNTMTFKKFT